MEEEVAHVGAVGKEEMNIFQPFGKVSALCHLLHGLMGRAREGLGIIFLLVVMLTIQF